MKRFVRLLLPTPGEPNKTILYYFCCIFWDRVYNIIKIFGVGVIIRGILMVG